MKYVLYLLIIPWAYSDTFHYIVTNYPNGTQSCHQIAQKLGDRFQEVTQLNVLELVCLNKDRNGYDIKIVYEAPKALQAVTTLTGLYWDRYSDIETCQKNLAAQTQIFESATQLPVVFSYCRKTDALWAPAITAFGEPRRMPFSHHYFFFHSHGDIPRKEYVNGLRIKLEQKDAILADIIVSSAIGMNRMSIYYFAKEKLNIGPYEVAGLPKQAQCEKQKEELLSMIGGLLNPPFVVYCGFVRFSAKWELNAIFVGEPSFSFRKSIEEFKDLAYCEAERARVVHWYQQTENNILGGLCTHDTFSNKYKIVLIKN